VNELTLRYTAHWFIDNPQRGSAYRCILNNQRLDSSINKAATKAGIKLDRMVKMLAPLVNKPLFINPGSVVLHLSNNSIITLYDKVATDSNPATPNFTSTSSSDTGISLSENMLVYSPNSSRPVSPSALLAHSTLSNIITKVVSVA
jgi:hypothetical protein